MLSQVFQHFENWSKAKKMLFRLFPPPFVNLELSCQPRLLSVRGEREKERERERERERGER